MKKKFIAVSIAMLLMSGCAAPDTSAVEASAASAASASVIASYEAKASEEAAASSSAAAESLAAEEKATAEAKEAAKAKAKAEAAKQAASPSPLGKRYNSIEDLIAAYEDAGGTCSNTTSSGAGHYSTDAVHCDEKTVLSIFANRAEALENIAQVRGLYAGSDVEVEGIWVVGQNWIVNAHDGKLVQKAMGGTIEIE